MERLSVDMAASGAGGLAPPPTSDPPGHSATWLAALDGAGLNPDATLKVVGDRPSAPVMLVDAPHPGQASAPPAAEEQHGKLWWWLHDHGGLVITKHERADILRRGWGAESGVIVRDKDGTPINVDQLSDDEIIALDKELRGQPIGRAAVGAAAPVMTQWGWQGSRQYRDAVSQLRQAGTHETLGGKVPSRAEATRMIEESGGKVVRQDEGHPPGGVSTHHEPHINYTTPSGAKATVIVTEK